MNLKNLKIDLPKTWRESSRTGGENQFYIKIYHISPISKVDPKILQEQSLPSPNPNVTITKRAVPAAARPPLRDFYDGMKAMISSGLMPPEYTMQKLDDLYKQLTEGYYPGEGDFSGDISVAKYQNEEIARQSFKNMALMPTQGFDVPIPGGVKFPGLPENVSFTELLASDVYKKYLKENIPEEQLKQMGGRSGFEKQLEEARVEIKKVQKQIQEEVKPSLAKSGVKHKETKYLGHEVICVESKNPTPPPKPKSSSSSKNVPGGGGGFDDRFDPLPKIPQPYQEKIVIYQAMLIKNFVVTGSLLWAAVSLPPGDTPCYSLTQTKKKTTTMREGGQVFTDIAIVPVVSNYAKEGYLHKEEVEEIFKSFLKILESR